MSVLPFMQTTNCMVTVWRGEYPAAFTADYKLYGYGVERWVSCCLYCRLWTVMVWRCEHTHHSLNRVPTTQLEIPNALCKVPVIQSVTYSTKVHWSARKHRTPLWMPLQNAFGLISRWGARHLSIIINNRITKWHTIICVRGGVTVIIVTLRQCIMTTLTVTVTCVRGDVSANIMKYG